MMIQLLKIKGHKSGIFLKRKIKQSQLYYVRRVLRVNGGMKSKYNI